MFRIGERLEVSPLHEFFYNKSKIWIYNGYNGYHSVLHPVTGEERNLIMNKTLVEYFKKARPSRLENK